LSTAAVVVVSHSAAAVVDKILLPRLCCRRRPTTKAKPFLSDKIINLDDDSSSDEGSVGSDVDEIVQWDRELLQTKTYTTAFTILVSNRKYDGRPEGGRSAEAFTPFYRLSSGRLLQEEVKGGKGFQRAEGRLQTWMEDGDVEGEGVESPFCCE
jgi:hypothetical protein